MGCFGRCQREQRCSRLFATRRAHHSTTSLSTSIPRTSACSVRSARTRWGTGCPSHPFLEPSSVGLVAAASGGGPVRFEAHFPDIDKHLSVLAFAIEPGRLTLLLERATAERKAEIERRRWLEERERASCARRVDGKVRDTETLFRNTVENIPVNLILCDRDYRILYINPALASMCAVFSGRAPSEIVGRYGPESGRR